MWKKIVRKYNNWKLGTKLLFGFVMGSIIPLLVILTIGYSVNREVLSKKIDQLMVNNLTQIAERVHLNIETYSSLLYQIYTDDEIIENISIMTDNTRQEYAFAYNRIYNKLKQYNNSSLGIRSICIVCVDGSSITADFQTDSVLDNIWTAYPDLRQTEPYVNCIGQPNMVLTPTMRFVDKGREKYYFHMSKRLFDFAHLDMESIGTVIMSIDERMLEKICNSGEESNQELDEHSLNFIVTEERRVVTYPDASFAGLGINPKLDIADFVRVSGFLQKQNTAVNQYKDPETGWIFYNVYDQDYMLKDLLRAQMILLLAGSAAVLIVILIMIYTIYMVNRSVQSLLQGIFQVQEGNLDTIVPQESEDEFGVIARNFNIMTARIRESIQKEQEARNRQKDAEIRALEAQINPHFLYNTLDSINWMAIERGEYEISTMLRNLGVILRYSVNKSNQLVALWEMQDWLHKYISLQQMRFNHAFTYDIHFDESTLQAKIHKLLLQPFVENAIIHGFDEMESGGYLHVECRFSEEEKFLIFIIEDNGAGMPQERVEEFNDPKRAILDDGRSIGLHNAFARMHMYYEDRASWTISSILGLGTVVTLRIPTEEKTGENEHEDTDCGG
ncbi:MAG: histidine kinase [Lachnospiraceae bacterium]|nr:histidine kinase [Lachnospiraceae bacterium]